MPVLLSALLLVLDVFVFLLHDIVHVTIVLRSPFCVSDFCVEVDDYAVIVQRPTDRLHGNKREREIAPAVTVMLIAA